MAALSLEEVLKAVEELRREVTSLKADVAAFKAQPSGSATSAEEVSEETLVLLAAAATTFLGKKVRVRSAKMLQTPYEIINPWAQHGRVFIQASHQLQRGY
ncbi:hypothetical protein [Telmatospirillum sp.]|uniref:hypothetical protein n=1 Tax=Telmatospirillum sp. TaxID=2079197 RepID=UPI00284C84DD|nr:hypothetical protein [Telmatospirillum sp.]MDR3437053.1 hypothetical protein [Telmatospirillum sp.]